MSAMPTDVLTTKLFVPLPRLNALARPALIARLNAGLHRVLTLVAAPAGFGKTTLVSAWVAGLNRPVAWLSLDPEDRDAARLYTAPNMTFGVLAICAHGDRRTERRSEQADGHGA